jgi:hypothetical protein
MAPPPSRPSFFSLHRLLPPACVAAFLLLSGCAEQDEIRHYTARRLDPAVRINPAHAARVGEPAYDVPAGWTEAPAGQFNTAVYKAEDGKVEITVSEAGGGIVANVNRWRTLQLKLPEATAAQIEKELRKMDVDGEGVPYADLSGPGGKDRILGVIVPAVNKSWFFKMRGPSELVEKQKDTFEKWVKSVRFGANPGGKDG